MSEGVVQGTVHVVEDTKTYGQNGFRKRLVVLEQETGALRIMFLWNSYRTPVIPRTA